MTATINNFTETTRHALCAVVAALIVTAGLTLGAVGADAAYQSALAQVVTATTTVA
jgi:hypothetical protein